jgi:hypothetical protein
MIYGATFPMSAGVIALALLAGGTGQEGAAYFPQSLREATLNCGLMGLGRRQTVMTELGANWYGGHLRAAGEAPIFENQQPTLRFTWLRSFHAPVVIRLDTAADGAVLMTATELSGQGGYEPGVVARRVERRLTITESAVLARMLEETDALGQPPAECALGLDGAQWILESAGPGGYHFVDRQSPDDGPVRELGLHLLGLTGWTHDQVY